MSKVNIKATVLYVVNRGVVLWYTLYKTGVHPTLAGVILGLMTPNIKKVEGKTETVIEWLEDRFHPLSTFFVVPLFAFANTGVIFNLDSLTQASKSVSGMGNILWISNW
jgi:Na+:H+ antiporter, NhaA family